MLLATALSGSATGSGTFNLPLQVMGISPGLSAAAFSIAAFKEL